MLSNDDKGKLVKLLKELVSAGVTDDKTLNDKLIFIVKKLKSSRRGKYLKQLSKCKNCL